jgi:protein SCO1/2
MERRTLLFGLAVLAGCAKQAAEKRYTLKGDVLRVDPTTRMATIKGDKIEGWMEAMTMEYPVKEKSEFAKLSAGDRITATVFVGEANYHIGDIKVTGKAGAPR